MKVVLIQGLLAPYRYPIFEELAKTPGLSMEVWFMGKRVKNRIWEQQTISDYSFKHKFMKGITLNFGIRDTYPFWVNFGMYKLLKRNHPDAVIMMGWDSLTSFLTHILCRFLNIKFILYSDSTANELSWRRTLTLPIVMLHVRTSDALICGGTLSKMYLEKLGAPPKKIFVSYNTVDVKKYKELLKRYKGKRQQLKEKLGLGSKRVILYYAQLIERKGADILLAAFKKLKKRYGNISLLVVGDGYFKENIEQIVVQEKLDDVVIIGNPGDNEICKYYCLSDIFVLPSREDVWGLVVNEAMAASLPVIVSDKAGCARDLVRDGINGYVFKSENINDLVDKLSKLLKNKSLLANMAKNSFDLIKLYTPEFTVKRFREAIKSTFYYHKLAIVFSKPMVAGKVSVIIPEHKDKDGLRKTLMALKKQTAEFPVEIIVEHDQGPGSYATRNKALARSSGEFIGFIDTGSIPAKDWLSRGWLKLKRYDYVGGRINVIAGSSKWPPRWLLLFEKNREFAVEDFMQDMRFSPTTNLFVKRKVFEKLGGFDARIKSSGDLEFGDRVYRSGDFLQYYDDDLVVAHNARSIKEVIDKQARLAKGFYDLGKFYPERFGRYKFSLVKSLIKFVMPPLWLFDKRSWLILPLGERLAVFLTTYIISALQYLFFIRYGLLRER